MASAFSYVMSYLVGHGNNDATRKQTSEPPPTSSSGDVVKKNEQPVVTITDSPKNALPKGDGASPGDLNNAYEETDVHSDVVHSANVAPTFQLIPPPSRTFLHTKDDLCDGMQFDAEQHVYTVDGEPVISVTTLIAKFFEEFDAEAVINRHYKQWQKNPQSPYHGMTKQDIEDSWTAANQEGTWMHSQIEAYFQHEKPSMEELREKDPIVFGQFCDFRRTVELDNIYGIELRLGLSGLIAGTIDLVTINPKTNCLTLYDWKRTKPPQIMPTAWHFNKYGKKPLHWMKDNKYNRYSVQLNMYKYLVEQHTGLTVEAMYLVQLHPDLENYHLMKIEELDIDVELLVEEASKEETKV